MSFSWHDRPRSRGRGLFVAAATAAAALGATGAAGASGAHAAGTVPSAAREGAAASSAGGPGRAGAARRAQRANLVVDALSRLPAEVDVAGSFALRVSVKNIGRRTARSSRTAYWLSADRHLSRGDIALPDGLARVTSGSLGPGRTWSARGRIVTPAATLPRSYYLLVCVDATRRVREQSERNCRPSTAQITVRRAAGAPAVAPPPAAGSAPTAAPRRGPRVVGPPARVPPLPPGLPSPGPPGPPPPRLGS
jgi:CARDB